ncbi:zinc finger CCCH domain-containing protein 14 [Drosophila willistoni]|uniref:zinc finger CCCH domain-containing protein 14 n=1 Tax=Drosophila willistoni TaxID=7260 RepID=UPI001F074A16|nr:zinc finger CCCH domain-containing protein 14 [Drosophila willistoni]
MDCNLGSEIGQKMRSAVKAKLLELGTGGSAGFIDDELPDYVMVMVANKRTKQQMNAELNLFLGDQTDLFVTWLHEVLQKLQEVTLPVASASNKKSRKSRLSETSASKVAVVKEKEKDKKFSKKDRRPSHRKSIGDEQHDGGTGGSSEAMATVISGGGSITDVFAEELLEKAKKSLDADHTAKDEIILNKKKNNKRKSGEGQDFDIPTISEISSTTSAPTTTAGNREKDLAELAAIQKKIEAAKKHLRKIGEIDVYSDDDEEAEEAEEEEMEDEQPHEKEEEGPKLKTIESESGVHDDDLLNLNAHEESSLESSLKEASIQRKAKSPIVFNRREKSPREATPPGKDERQEQRRSVHERLGSKAKAEMSSSSVPDRERSQRTQKELYVPAHRRRSEPETRSQRERSRSRSHDRRPSRNDNTRESNRNSARQRRSSPSPEIPQAKQRIGSRVIVAVHKSPEPSDDEDLLEKPVNSVIKIKPRPHVSPRRQASKNLLLRAVAEAQRSTILAKSITTSSAGSKLSAPRHKDADDLEMISSTLGKRKLIEKSIESRDKIRGSKRSIAPANNELFRRSTRDLVVNVIGKRKKRSEVEQQQEPNEEEEDDEEHKVIEEYVPIESNEKLNFEAYVPEQIDMHISSHSAAKTQFVVTLNGEHSYRNKGTKASSPQVPQMASCMEPTVSSSSSRRLKSGRGRSSSPSPTSSNTPPPSSHMGSRSLNRSEVIRQSQEIKKIIIKNNVDTDEDDELHHRSPKKNGHKDINKSTKSHTEERSTTPPLPVRSKTSRPEKRATNSGNKDQKPSQSSGSEPGSGSVETTGHLVNSHNEVTPSQVKAKHTPIRFTLKPDGEPDHKKRRSRSVEQEVAIERRKIPIRHAEDRKYDNLPTLSAVSVDSAVLKVSSKQQQQLPAKERCKYHPNCTKQFCEYYHPTAPCKTFPNCKFADKCMYSHPKCKYDMSCMSIDCNFAHSGVRDLSHGHQLMAPPLSSHVIPVQNYKSISAPVTTTTATTMCKFYPNCTKVGCTFHHPKLCRFGKNCVNKLECVFYHPEMQSKFKWVASMG